MRRRSDGRLRRRDGSFFTLLVHGLCTACQCSVSIHRRSAVVVRRVAIPRGPSRIFRALQIIPADIFCGAQQTQRRLAVGDGAVERPAAGLCQGTQCTWMTSACSWAAVAGVSASCHIQVQPLGEYARGTQHIPRLVPVPRAHAGFFDQFALRGGDGGSCGSSLPAGSSHSQPSAA